MVKMVFVSRAGLWKAGCVLAGCVSLVLTVKQGDLNQSRV